MSDGTKREEPALPARGGAGTAQHLTNPEPAGGISSAQRAERLAQLAPREKLAALDAQAELGGGQERIDKQHQDGVVSLAGYAEIFWRNVQSSGVVPQLSAILGPCAGGAVYSPAITDFIVMAKGSSYMFITGPDVIKTVTHEEVTKEDLGGAQTHNAKSGVAHFAAEDEAGAIRTLRELLSYLPQNNLEDPPAVPTRDPPYRAAAGPPTPAP